MSPYNYLPYYYSPFGNPTSRKYQRHNMPRPKSTKLQTTSRPKVETKQVKKSNDASHKLTDDPLFEIFGIKLYSDDILLLCLIFFLYTEGVQDQYLFIALILLLLS